jgi:hypothetical protein
MLDGAYTDLNDETFGADPLLKDLESKDPVSNQLKDSGYESTDDILTDDSSSLSASDIPPNPPWKGGNRIDEIPKTQVESLSDSSWTDEEVGDSSVDEDVDPVTQEVIQDSEDSSLDNELENDPITNPGFDNVRSKRFSVDDPTTDNLAADEVRSKRFSVDNPTTDDLTADEVRSKRFSVDNPTTDDLTADEVRSKRFSVDDPTTDDNTTDEVGSNSELGHIVISDRTEGAKFTGNLGESNQNSGEYQGVKTVTMTPGETFGIMLVPNGTVQEVFDNPAIGGNKRPLFSMVTANPNEAFHLGQITDVTGDGNTFVLEDLRVDRGTDNDFNDVIFQVTGATGVALSWMM